MARKALLGRLGDVDIRLLRIFRAVVNCSGLAAAELELNIGRSTISRHLSDLELRLGIKLCNRGPAGFSLTDPGKQVFEAALRLLSAIDRFQNDVDNIHQHPTGQLRIALFDHTATNSSARVSQAFRSFDEIAPKVDLDIAIEPTNVIETGVLDGRFDLGVVPIHRKSTSLEYMELYSEQMYLYCGRGHPLFGVKNSRARASEIRKSKYAGLGFHSPNLVVSNRMKLLRSAVAQDQEALAVLILSGRYLGFLPDHFAIPFVDAEKMQPVGTRDFRYASQFAAIVRRHPKPSGKTAIFLDCLRAAHQA